MKNFRIISFDGGGIRGAVSTRILKRLVTSNPNLLSKTDLFAGTSTGAIIALSLAFGLSIDAIDNLYCYDNLKKIFGHKSLNLFHPKYKNTDLKNLITSTIPIETTLKDLKKYVFIPAFNVYDFSDVFFNNLSENSTIKETVLDACLASSAAPTYFPSHKNFIDGGLVTNSPSIASVIAAIHDLSPKYKLENFRVLSIGTGDNPKKITSNTTNWGVLKWAFNPFSKVKSPITSVLLDDTSSLADRYCIELLGDNYLRINPLITCPIELDDYKKLNTLTSISDNYNLDEANTFIKKYFLPDF